MDVVISLQNSHLYLHLSLADNPGVHSGISWPCFMSSFPAAGGGVVLVSSLSQLPWFCSPRQWREQAWPCDTVLATLMQWKFVVGLLGNVNSILKEGYKVVACVSFFFFFLRSECGYMRMKTLKLLDPCHSHDRTKGKVNMLRKTGEKDGKRMGPCCSSPPPEVIDFLIALSPFLVGSLLQLKSS